MILSFLWFVTVQINDCSKVGYSIDYVKELLKLPRSGFVRDAYSQQQQQFFHGAPLSFFYISFRPKKGKGNNLPVAAAVALPVTPYHERGKLIYKTSFTKVNLIFLTIPAQEFSTLTNFLIYFILYFKNLIYYIRFTKVERSQIMPLAKISTKHQITIPKKVFNDLGLAVGDTP